MTTRHLNIEEEQASRTVLFIKYSYHGPRVGKIWYLQAALDFPLHKEGQLVQDIVRSQRDKQEYLDKEMT